MQVNKAAKCKLKKPMMMLLQLGPWSRRRRKLQNKYMEAADDAPAKATRMMLAKAATKTREDMIARAAEEAPAMEAM